MKNKYGTAIGYSAMKSMSTGNKNIAIGRRALNSGHAYRTFYICNKCNIWDNNWFPTQCNICGSKDIHIVPKHIPRQQRIKYITKIRNRYIDGNKFTSRNV